MLLDEFNDADAATAVGVVGVWAAIPSWVDAVVAARPYGSVDELEASARKLAGQWTTADLDAAIAHHPRIGQRPAGDGAEAAASRQEQAAMTDAATGVTEAIAAGNAAYEERFGRVFLIRAAGRAPEEILVQLERRLRNDDETEDSEALGQLAEIAILRLRASVTEFHTTETPEREDHSMSHLTTHVLDAATGAPAAGIAVELADARGLPVDDGVTDADGRANLGPELLPAGEYTLAFRTGAYFAALGVETFYPFVAVTFSVEAAGDGMGGRDSHTHLHVPLLLSPFAYSTYRGS